MNRIWIAGLVLAGMGVVPAFAVETFKPYDNFATAPINGNLWTSAERNVAIKSGALNIVQRAYGQTDDNVGTLNEDSRMRLSTPAEVTEMRAKIIVNALEVNGCTANPTPSATRARLNGAFFNVGTPVPGSETGDVLAQARIIRYSNSTDAAGVLRVQGVLLTCTNADCSTSTAKTVDLGTTVAGKAVTLQMQWDKPNRKFLYSRDAGAFSGSIPYTDNDATPPSQPFKSVDVRADVASCTAGALTGFVNATFDSVAVNASAAP